MAIYGIAWRADARNGRATANVRAAGAMGCGALDGIGQATAAMGCHARNAMRTVG